MTKRKKRFLGCLGVFAVIAIGAGIFFGPALKDFWDQGIIQALLEGDKKKEYTGNRRERLKDLYTGLMLYHESEGQFPNSAGWMDAIKSRIQSNELTETEARKKFAKPNGGGYAFNDAASEKYKGDLNPGTVLVYESDEGKWNAHGKPSDNGLTVTLEGTIK